MNMGTFGTLDVYCDMDTADGGWIVIQRNSKGPGFSFNRNWREYEEGFGSLDDHFWYGLKLIHILTRSGQWEMIVDYRSMYIHYNQFKVGSDNEKYKLTVGGYTGGRGDYFNGGNQPLNNTFFSTPDNDNDLYEGNCAVEHKSGWWYNQCYNINPNAKPPQPNLAYTVEMKIRPKDCI